LHCGQKGHYRVECPKKKPTVKRPSAQSMAAKIVDSQIGREALDTALRTEYNTNWMDAEIEMLQTLVFHIRERNLDFPIVKFFPDIPTRKTRKKYTMDYGRKELLAQIVKHAIQQYKAKMRPK
jgi:hypothetical protein